MISGFFGDFFFLGTGTSAFLILSLSLFSGFDFMMVSGWGSMNSVLACTSIVSLGSLFSLFFWFYWSSVNMSKFSSSRWTFLFFRLELINFSCFLIGFDLLSIFCRTTYMKLVWHLVSIFIFLRALELIDPFGPSFGALRPWTILSVFWFLLFWRCLYTILG